MYYSGELVVVGGRWRDEESYDGPIQPLTLAMNKASPIVIRKRSVMIKRQWLYCAANNAPHGFAPED